MSGRRRAYKRAEHVLAHDKLMTVGSIDTLKSEVEKVLSTYMNVHDMYVSFKSFGGGRYAIKIESRVDGITIPNSIS